MNDWIMAVISGVGSIALGVITFFLKRTMNQIDKCASKEDVEILDVRVSKTEKTIDRIKEDYITKDDFFREQAKTDKKLDRIMDILLEMKGGK